VRLSFSGDYPASPINNPFWAIKTAVTRSLAAPERYGIERAAQMGSNQVEEDIWLRNPSERIGIKAAVEAYTMGGAYQLFREDEIGSLEVGKFADFIVLDRDIMKVASSEIDGTRVLATYIGGVQVQGID